MSKENKENLPPAPKRNKLSKQNNVEEKVPENIDENRCSQCKARFDDVKALMEHVRTHFKAFVLPTLCVDTGRRTRDVR